MFVAFFVGSGAALATESARAAFAEPRSAALRQDLMTYDAGGYRYAYQVITGREALFHLPTDPKRLHNLAGTHAELTHEMRHALESRLGVTNLDVLRSRYSDSIRTLRSLGYL